MFHPDNAFRPQPRGNGQHRTAKAVSAFPRLAWHVSPDIEAYLSEVGHTPTLTLDEERALGWSVINDNCPASRDRMLRANLRLVVVIAHNYTNRGVSLATLIEEGNAGLHCAVEGFDPAQGIRFSTYAGWWIKQSIKRAVLNAAHPVEVPA